MWVAKGVHLESCVEIRGVGSLPPCGSWDQTQLMVLVSGLASPSTEPSSGPGYIFNLFIFVVAQVFSHDF